MSANYMVGIISYMPETDRGKLRIPIHQEQLRWLEGLAGQVRDKFEVYRRVLGDLLRKQNVEARSI